ncbi:hypothetical protein EJB05_38800 [Eragrostis curvula]|uniref:Uncharacterized protein n=1 Tax=Eragrostis curvula TaxID=38414 RepID=A0A5J9TWR6_9POAL|nr:hypothetical protein EJB05_38800 [Eragrostis curvula]
MKSYRLAELIYAEVTGLKARPQIDFFFYFFGTVNPIVEDVRVRGDAAVKEEFFKQFQDSNGICTELVSFAGSSSRIFRENLM